MGEVNEIVERQRERVKCCYLDLEDMLENGGSVLEMVPRVSGKGSRLRKLASCGKGK